MDETNPLAALFGQTALAAADAVEYELYVDGPAATAATLAAARTAYLDFVAPFVRGYIWHADPFGLAVASVCCQ